MSKKHEFVQQLLILRRLRQELDFDLILEELFFDKSQRPRVRQGLRHYKIAVPYLVEVGTAEKRVHIADYKRGQPRWFNREWAAIDLSNYVTRCGGQLKEAYHPAAYYETEKITSCPPLAASDIQADFPEQDFITAVDKKGAVLCPECGSPAEHYQVSCESTVWAVNLLYLRNVLLPRLSATLKEAEAVLSDAIGYVDNLAVFDWLRLNFPDLPLRVVNRNLQIIVGPGVWADLQVNRDEYVPTEEPLDLNPESDLLALPSLQSVVQARLEARWEEAIA